MTRPRFTRIDDGQRSAPGERIRRDIRARFIPSDQIDNPVASPSGRPRFDPHQGRTTPQEALGVMAPSGRIRRDRQAERDPRLAVRTATVVRRQGAAPSAKPLPLVTVDDPAYILLVVPDFDGDRLTDHDRELISAAHVLAGDSTGAVVVLAPAGIPGLDLAGADRVLPCARLTAYTPELRAGDVLAAVNALEPRHILFGESSSVGADLGRRVAAALGEVPATHVVTLAPDELKSRGWSGRIDAIMVPPRVLLLEEQVAVPLHDHRREARLLEPVAPAAGVQSRIVEEELFRIDPDLVPIAEADFIVSAGNGVIDWDAFRDVAAALGGTRGGSRIACDLGHLPRNRQVGASGTLVKPRCYLAFGIAGAPQHLQGIRDCERVVAINTNLHADMVKRADLSIIADAQAVMPALTELVARRRKGNEA